MTARALLIGIDAYTGAPALDGCVNDIDAIQRILLDRMQVPPERITRLASPRFGTMHDKRVPSQPATLANLRAALRALSDPNVKPSDRLFIHYSGHGTQLAIEAGGKRFFREALVPTDHSIDGERRYLFDWELNQLLADIVQRTQNVTFVLDCCCASGATRRLAAPSTRVARFFDATTSGPVVLDAMPFGVGRLSGLKSGLSGIGACQVVAACLDDERAEESGNPGAGAGVKQGELTRALVAALDTVPDAELRDLRWGRIWQRALQTLRTASPGQHPWRSGGDARFVFGGPPETGDHGFVVTAEDTSYLLDVGQLAGITEDAVIAVYGALPLLFPSLGSPADLAARIGLLRVVAAGESTAEAIAVGNDFQPVHPFDLEPGCRGRLVRAGGEAKLRVALSPPEPAILARLAESSIVTIVESGEDAKVVRTPSGAWAITDELYADGSGPDDPTLDVLAAVDVAFVRPWLEHYYALTAPVRFARASTSLPNALTLTLLDCNGMGPLSGAQAQDPPLPEAKRGTKSSYELGENDAFCIRVDNHSDRVLFVTLMTCQATGEVDILGEKQLGRGMHVFWFGEEAGQAFKSVVAAGRRLQLDRVIAVGTTKLDARLGFLASGQSFSRVMDASRAGNPDPHREAKPGAVDLWCSALLTVLTRR